MAATLPTADEVRAIVREELARALAEIRGASPEVMDTHQAAAYSRRSAKTIRAWIAKGLPATRRDGELMVRRDDLDRWRAGAPEEGRAVTLAAVRLLTGSQ
jgi:hypothetical protein